MLNIFNGGRSKRRFIDAVREDMQVIGVTREYAEDKVRWRRVVRCGDSLTGIAEGRKLSKLYVKLTAD